MATTSRRRTGSVRSQKTEDKSVTKNDDTTEVSKESDTVVQEQESVEPKVTKTIVSAKNNRYEYAGIEDRVSIVVDMVSSHKEGMSTKVRNVIALMNDIVRREAWDDGLLFYKSNKALVGKELASILDNIGDTNTRLKCIMLHGILTSVASDGKKKTTVQSEELLERCFEDSANSLLDWLES